jgi:copper chaperone CopZ
MKTFHIGSFVMLCIAVAAGPAVAGEVKIEKTHLCCGACLKAVDKALDGVEGVSDVARDQKTKTITFAAADEKAAKAGIDALAKAGFHGDAKHGDKKIKFPGSGAKKDQKSNRIVLTGVHLCCGACVKAVAKALDEAEIDGVEGKACDREKKTVTVEGNDVVVLAVVKALNKAGFHGTLEKKEKEE